MKRLLWRKILLPCLPFLLVLFLLTLLKGPPWKKKDTSLYKDVERPSINLQQILAEVQEKNARRIERIEQVCKKYNLGIFKTSNAENKFKYPPTPQYSVFYFDVRNKIAYCPTYKAGSTTWLYNLLTLNGVKEESITGKQISEVARVHFPELDGDDAEEKFPECKGLLSVRHPFDRILSAYRDKLEDKDRAPEHGTRHYYQRWGSRIRDKYRKSGRLEPTFEEFVRYLIDTNILLYADDHWIPYNAYCTPCLIRYDYVATAETLNEDQLFFIHSLGLSSSLAPNKRHSSKKLSSQVAKDYYAQITKDQVRKLHKKYELDFEMFNYTIEPYLTFAND